MDYFQTLQRWVELKAAIQRLTNEERALREGLFNGTFPDPREGVNSLELPDGSVLKGTYSYNRNVVPEYRTIFEQKKVPAEVESKIITLKPQLSVKEYKALPDALRKKVDAALEIKPALPKLDFIPAKVTS